MKIIDLEFLISNKEKVPKVIVYEGEIYGFRDDLNDYENQYADFEEGINKFKYLFENPLGKNFIEFFNDEVEIIEEQQEDNFTGFKMFQNGKCFLSMDANQEVKYGDDILIEEDKKIEKIHWKPKESLNGEFNSKEKQEILARRTERLKKSINEIIDWINEE